MCVLESCAVTCRVKQQQRRMGGARQRLRLDSILSACQLRFLPLSSLSSLASSLHAASHSVSDVAVRRQNRTSAEADRQRLRQTEAEKEGRLCFIRDPRTDASLHPNKLSALSKQHLCYNIKQSISCRMRCMKRRNGELGEASRSLCFSLLHSASLSTRLTQLAPST